MNDASVWKELVWDVAVKAALSLLFAAVPWLGDILNPIVILFTDKLFEVISQFIEVSAIQMRNSEHQREFEAKSIELRQAAKNLGLDSDEYKKVRMDAQAALSVFVHFGSK